MLTTPVLKALSMVEAIRVFGRNSSVGPVSPLEVYGHLGDS